VLNAEIEANQQRIDSLNSYIDEKRAALDQKIELNKLGFASNVEGKQKEIAELEKQRAKALADQRKAQKAQILLDSGLQAANLVTAGSNLFKTFSAIPVVGVPLAIAAIAAMTGAFIASKAKELQAVGPSFRKGGSFDLSTSKEMKGQLLQGPSHEQGGIHLVNPRTGQKLAEYEGNEMLFAINKKATKEHLPMLEAINTNNFSHINVRNRTIQRLIQEESIQLQQGVAQRIIEQHIEISNYHQHQHNYNQMLGDVKEIKQALAQIANTNKSIDLKTLGKMVQTNPDGSISIIEKNRTTRIKLKP
jgi:hypothetical protein